MTAVCPGPDNQHLCPECGAAIVLNRDRLLMSNPAQYPARCVECFWHGTAWERAPYPEEDDGSSNPD